MRGCYFFFTTYFPALWTQPFDRGPRETARSVVDFWRGDLVFGGTCFLRGGLHAGAGAVAVAISSSRHIFLLHGCNRSTAGRVKRRAPLWIFGAGIWFLGDIFSCFVDATGRTWGERRRAPLWAEGAGIWFLGGLVFCEGDYMPARARLRLLFLLRDIFSCFMDATVRPRAA